MRLKAAAFSPPAATLFNFAGARNKPTEQTRIVACFLDTLRKRTYIIFKRNNFGTKMEQKLVLVLIVFLLIPIISAIRINEVELNPAGEDSGNEWVELYSDEEVDLNEWKLVNGDGKEFTLNQSFSGYLIINFEKQWLDNSDERVFLYEEGNLIDETNILDDSKNNNLAWSFCEDWVFVESTKGSENLCENEEPVEDVKREETKQKEEIKQEEPNKQNNESKQLIGVEADNETEKIITENEVIKLNSITQENSKVYKSKSEYIKEYSIYGYMVLLAIIGILLLIKSLKQIRTRKPKEV